ncbi:Multidrug resistance protein 1 [Bulinus truncatus]|nr:Multidrug resistance protein 1 [Bulinus truncatus]
MPRYSPNKKEAETNVSGQRTKDNGLDSTPSNPRIVVDDDSGSVRGCCGRAKQKSEMVGIFELFRFATCLDKVLMVIGTIGAICQGVTIPVNVAIFGDIIDAFVDDHTTNSTKQPLDEMVLPYIYAFIIIGIASFFCSFFAVACWQWAAERQINRIRKTFFHSVLRQDIGWFDVNESGEISTTFTANIGNIADGMGDKMAVFIQWFITWVASYVMAFTRSWKLTLVVAIGSPLLIITGATLVRVMRKMAGEEAQAYAKAGAVAEQAFRSIRTVQAFQGQDKEIARYNENLVDAIKVASKKGIALGFGNSAVWFLLMLMFAGVVWFGTYLMQADNLAPGKILPVFFGVMIGSTALGHAFNNLESLSNARGAAIKIYDMISMIPKIDAFSEEGIKLQNFKGIIELKNIKFYYPARPDVQILKSLNLNVQPGQHVALVGSSGCGKSTTVQLIQRFYDPQEGTVLIDGHDIRTLNIRWFRSNIGVVSQEPSLFDATIEENIRFGKMDATETDIQNAAKEANAHDFIMQLPEKYKTNVGERGAQLSGGQKQRISIARALVRNPKILLLDEATSALDQESEAIVQNALEKAQKGRTTITIAHRLTTIQHADKIVALSNGEVLEEGTHTELLEAKGLYSQLVHLQAQIKKEADVDISDVEIVEDEEITGKILEDELSRTSFRRTMTTTEGKENKEIHLVARASFKKQKKNSKKENHQKETEEELSHDATLKELMEYNAPEWLLILFGCIGSIVCGCIFPAFAFLMSEYIKLFGITDHDEQWTRVHILGGVVILVSVLSAIVRMLQDMDYFDKPSNQVGSLTSKLSGDAALVQGATGSKIGLMLEAAATIIAALLIALIYGWKLTLVVLAFMPLMFLGGFVQGKVIAGASKKDRKQLQQAGKICSEVVDSIRTVVSLGREDYFHKIFNNLLNCLKPSSRKMSFVFGITYGIANCIIFFAYAVAFYYGAVLVHKKEMEFFEVFRVFSAIIFGGMMLGRQSSFGIDYTKAKVAAGRVIALINRKPKIDVRDTNGLQMADFNGNITFDNVSYTYPSRPNAKVLDGLKLVINPGETVALVGSSGCGKSTTIQLTERFYDAVSGTVSVNGIDLRNLNLKWYRSQLGIVSQEPTLFDCSIAENIAYGDNSRVVPMSEIIQAAKDANIHNFIASLPQGYDTNVGEKGSQLSGGQKQRIAIARALVRHPKVLLLDEATSSLDSESEKIVQEALDKASKDRTCITIAHRLSTIRNADKIAVVSKGKIIEIGNHQQLLTIKGAYYRLLMVQNREQK